MSTFIFGIALAIIVALASYIFVLSPKERKVLKPDQFQEFPLIQKTVLSHNSAIYRFGLPKPNDVLGLPIGQHISIGAEINGKEIVRSYTPLSNDSEKGYFDLLIKVYPQGNITKHVDNLKIGECIKVRGPKGFFQYTPNMVKEFGMVAGGTGITPMYQIITAITNNPEDKTKVTLLYGNVTENDILLRAELDKLSAEHPNFTVYHVLNTPPEGWEGGVGFITPEILKEKLPKAAAETTLLLCGPPPMTSAIKRATVDLGFEKAKAVSKSGDQVFVF
ncbi:hypothetical protein BABINDRAFT_166070 [Babjeviella inositovora NRRL Y-12698]|uniref:NADH-cytochrome b5 reductase n=1 Tax=Babjeviella inositovora NRRL Y-12698 TaxID=984486 RepID=A0A1E3QUP0_9ASCO|nr:uncharacterized protein BABINDRAFT_166070 [Babjeviella inositovora NRRL Y-12698]ODQ81390.1 hypothetical protein BABINDRAFT_166070 [Babjeviella inositovora NRRL Y-12698]